MNRYVTSGKRYLRDDRWHDDNGQLPDYPLEWDPPMTDEEINIAALSDPDAQPSTPEQLARMKRVPLAKHVRWKLGYGQAEFAARFEIPIGTLRDWEYWRTEPDTAAIAYLRVILAEPEMVQRTLRAVPVQHPEPALQE